MTRHSLPSNPRGYPATGERIWAKNRQTRIIEFEKCLSSGSIFPRESSGLICNKVDVVANIELASIRAYRFACCCLGIRQKGTQPQNQDWDDHGKSCRYF